MISLHISELGALTTPRFFSIPGSDRFASRHNHPSRIEKPYDDAADHISHEAERAEDGHRHDTSRDQNSANSFQIRGRLGRIRADAACTRGHNQVENDFPGAVT